MLLIKLRSLKIKYFGGVQAIPARYYHIDKNVNDILNEEYHSQDKLSHFCSNDAENICQAINFTKHLNGDYVEIGTYQGFSARIALKYAKTIGLEKDFYFLDTYEGFTYVDAKNSEDAFWSNTHQDTSIQRVEKYLAGFRCNIIKSNIITDELPESIKKIAVCNIDVDMYEAVKSALNKVKNLIVSGG